MHCAPGKLTLCRLTFYFKCEPQSNYWENVSHHYFKDNVNAKLNAILSGQTILCSKQMNTFVWLPRTVFRSVGIIPTSPSPSSEMIRNSILTLTIKIIVGWWWSVPHLNAWWWIVGYLSHTEEGELEWVCVIGFLHQLVSSPQLIPACDCIQINCKLYKLEYLNPFILISFTFTQYKWYLMAKTFPVYLSKNFQIWISNAFIFIKLALW